MRVTRVLFGGWGSASMRGCPKAREGHVLQQPSASGGGGTTTLGPQKILWGSPWRLLSPSAAFCTALAHRGGKNELTTHL